MTLASQKKIGRAYAGVLMYIPTILGSILVSTLPFHNKVGLLFSYWISSECIASVHCHEPTDRLYLVSGITPFVISLAWIGSSTSGHTKRRSHCICSARSPSDCHSLTGITTNAIILGAYAVGNAAGPFMWKKRYQPRWVCHLLLIHVIYFHHSTSLLQ